MTTENISSKLLGRAIPKGIKRMMVLVTVFVQMEKNRGTAHPRLEDLNAGLHLAHDDTVLHRMADLSDVIFRSKACPISQNNNIVENCSQVVDWLPGWLRYADRREIITDLARVTTCHLQHCQ